LEFINATEDVAVFRNSPTLGTGSFMRIDEVTTTYAYQANMSAFEIMTDLDNGAGGFGSTWTVAKSNAASTASRWWFLFVSPTMLHLVIYSSLAPGTNPVPGVAVPFGVMTFGDFSPYATEAWPALAAYSYTSLGASLLGLTGTVTTHANAKAPRDYLSTANTPTLLFGGGMGPTVIGSTNDGLSGVSYNGKLLLAKICVQDAAATNWSRLRGEVPGIFIPCHPAFNFTLPFLSTYDGPGDTTYIVFPWQQWGTTSQYAKHFAFEFDTE
jgi:hypothetical protein